MQPWLGWLLYSFGLCITCGIPRLEALLMVTHALVISILDYCNLLYMGFPLRTFRTFCWCGQLMVSSFSVYALPLHHQLHCMLPVCFWVQIKVLIKVFFMAWHLATYRTVSPCFYHHNHLYYILSKQPEIEEREWIGAKNIHNFFQYK